MTRYDIYDQQLNPCDYICWCSRNIIYHGQIKSISSKGTLKVCLWSDEDQWYKILPVTIRAWQIIKVTGIPKRNNV